MALNDVIVYVDGAETTKPRIEFAAALAKDHGAHLIGVGFAPTALLPLYGVDAGFADMSEVLQSVKSQGETALHACKSHCEAQGVSIEIRLMQGVSDEFPRDFACCARHADITVLGQPRHGDPLIGQYALVERCLFASGRPVIIVPAAPTAMVRPTTVVVAWDGSPEAARACNDALIFLKQADRVVLLVGVPAEPGEDGEPRVEDMVAHLKRHAVAAEVVRLKLGGDDTGELLLGKTKELKTDMVVMGAFHHSKWRQFILGGVTLTMLEQATIPLFMAH
jgi:nucleotide-binding universal stress UspA family protein